ncbi:deoxyguanosinetriphosphate triphosphohydrolase [Verrucomicrobia bacterium SCGC AG-212-E04]|nr:deoxyguanosinetriphosphate triphosphohydrolase [Verrucomicrobia bacterium SCGC AG-212-E04]
MRQTREQMEEAELGRLAPYAQSSRASAGRTHAEAPHAFRPVFQRDRDRVLRSRAFRRLEYKTQVFLNGTGDHLRTRLTHTIEVAAIGRTIARALALNEDLVEAIALAHDLGHPPIGHSGEKTLDRLMRDHGGFDHNEQSRRIVEYIESPYPDFRGLNLSFEVIEGLQKHRAFYDPPPNAVVAGPHPSPSLEAQIANLADEITYYSHDLDDGLDSGLIAAASLEDVPLWVECRGLARERFPHLSDAEVPDAIIRMIIDREVEAVIATSAAAIGAAGVRSVEDVRRHPDLLIRYSQPLLAANQQLRRFLYQNLYFHPAVAQVNQQACDRLAKVFAAYLASPNLLGKATATRLAEDGLHRTVCDYLSGMTDRYLVEEHERLFGKSAL